MELEILGAHNCESDKARLSCILIDRILALDAGSLTSSLSADDQRSLKAVLITHHHFDHIRDLATLGMNVYMSGPIAIYAMEKTQEIISAHLINGVLYPDFRQRPSPEQPAFRFNTVEPFHEFDVEGYSVLPFPVSHKVPSVGYQVATRDNKTVVYTGDTCKNPASVWETLSPQLIITELSMPDRYSEMAMETGHLTPQLLKEELLDFIRVKGYRPRVITIHMNPHVEALIREESAAVAAELGVEISPGYEGMKVVL